MNNLERLIELASVARQHIIIVNRKAQLNTYLNRLPQDLEGGCGAASLHLMRLANNRGMHPKFVFGAFRQPHDSHCWLEYYNHVVDITATQFIKCDPVCVTNMKDIGSPYQYRDFTSRSFIKSKNRISGWAIYAPELTTFN